MISELIKINHAVLESIKNKKDFTLLQNFYKMLKIDIEIVENIAEKYEISL